MINEVSKPLSYHVPVDKICEKLKKKDSQICELKYGTRTEPSQHRHCVCSQVQVSVQLCGLPVCFLHGNTLKLVNGGGSGWMSCVCPAVLLHADMLLLFISRCKWLQVVHVLLSDVYKGTKDCFRVTCHLCETFSCKPSTLTLLLSILCKRHGATFGATFDSELVTAVWKGETERGS